MGRTNPTFRDLLTSLEGDWQDYRRALRRPDRDRFDRLWEDARRYADAGGYLNHQNPMVVVLFSMVLAHEQRIEDLEAELEGTRADSSDDETSMSLVVQPDCPSISDYRDADSEDGRQDE